MMEVVALVIRAVSKPEKVGSEVSRFPVFIFMLQRQWSRGSHARIQEAL